MDATLVKALQLVLSLSLLVILHEGGHFFFSKLFHVKVEKFFLFFDPYFHLFSTRDKWFVRLFPRFKDSETEYGIGWLPFGGYVKIAGMIDESMDTEQMKNPVQPWEFRAKPAVQRLFIMIGGVLVNFFLALFIYAMILFHWGEQYIPMKDMTMGFQFNEQAEQLGFRDGDILLAADGTTFKKWDAADVYRSVSEADFVTVIRSGQELRIDMPGDMNMLEMLKSEPPFMLPVVPAVIDSVMPDSPAWKAGMRGGERITAIGGNPVSTWYDFDVLIQSRRAMVADTTLPADSLAALCKLPVTYQAGGAERTDTLSLGLDYMLGVVKKASLAAYYEPTKVEYGFFGSIPAGIRLGIDVFEGYVSDLQYLFTSDGAKSVGSFITIGSIFPSAWDWHAFWATTAFLSIILAFMNILPIPALDGGHVLFLLVEMVTRRKPSEKLLERAQVVGMALVGGLMVLACYNDIVRFLL